MFVINKWDVMIEQSGGSSEMMNKYAYSVQHAFRTMAYAPIAFITAKTGKNVKALLNLGQTMFKQARRRVSTGTLNRVLRDAVQAHPPSMRENRTPKIYYATQVGTEPPTVVLFVNTPSLFDATYQRYLLNVFREKLPFKDIPIKLYLRARTQADLEERRSSSRREGADVPEPEGSIAGSRSGPGDSGFEFSREINDLLSDLDDRTL